jgi:hypothetical protein
MSDRNARTILILTMSLAVMLAGFDLKGNAQPPLPGPYPGLGAYSNFFQDLCGKQGVRWNPDELPSIGCFGLSSGKSASGTFSGLRFEIAVDSDSKELCKVNDTIIGAKEAGTATSLPNVVGSCPDLSFCDDGVRPPDCATILRLLARNSDGSIFFHISRRIGPHAYVTNQENWDAEQARRK